MQVDVDEAQARFEELVERAHSGEMVLIARNGTPVARLEAIHQTFAPVQLGLLAGQIEIGDDFDEPLPEFDD